MSIQDTSGQYACLFYFLPTRCPGIIATGSVDIITITHVLLCGPRPAHMSKTKEVMSVTASPDRQACCSTRILNVALNQLACLLELHLPADIFESVASDLQTHL